MTIDQQLKNCVVDGEACEEQDEVAVPKSGRHVVPDTLVFFRLVLILFLNTDNILFKIKTAERKSCDADKDEKYVSHALNIA